MKQTITLLVTALLMMAGVQTAQAQKMKIYFTSGEPVGYDIQKIDHIEFEESEPEVESEWVDLGLPSGTLWATYNVGASGPQDSFYGNYFAWGEITSKWNVSRYDWGHYRFSKSSNATLTKYCWSSSNGNYGYTDDLKELQPEDDAATVNWGSNWQIPSKEQFEELINTEYTTTEWIKLDGKYPGRLITSRKNGKSIFLPALGLILYDTSPLYNDQGCYWSRTLSTTRPDLAVGLNFSSDGISVSDINAERCLGFTVRPVRVQKANQ